MNHGQPELFQRHRRNPILTAADWPYPAHTVFNPAATLLPDGTTLLLCRVEDSRGHSHLSVACLLYTSDAADERSSVDLGGRRIIKKKNYRPTTRPSELIRNSK